MTEFTTLPLGPVTRAALDQRVAATTPLVMISEGVSETETVLAYAQAASRVSRANAVLHNMGALDQLYNDLECGDGSIIIVPTAYHAPTSWRSERLSLAAVAFTNSATPIADAMDRPWASYVDLSLLDHLITLGRVEYAEDDLLEPQARGSDWHPGAYLMAINEALLPAYRQGLLRLINGIRTILRLILIRVLSALSRCPDIMNAILLILAASRRYGRRTEPSDTPSCPHVDVGRDGEVARLR